VVEQDVGGGAAAGAIGLPVMEFAGHIVIPAQRVEVVLLVVVQRCFFTHPLPHRIRVIVDVGIVWIVIQFDRFGVCHLESDPFNRCGAGSRAESPARARRRSLLAMAAWRRSRSIAAPPYRRSSRPWSVRADPGGPTAVRECSCPRR